MQGDFVSSVLLPATPAFVMFSPGLGLVLLPLVCYPMARAFGIAGVFAMGLNLVMLAVGFLVAWMARHFAQTDGRPSPQQPTLAAATTAFSAK